MELLRTYKDKDLQDFAEVLLDLGRQSGVKFSARGWAYIMEGKRLINKDQFDKVNTIINKCRRKGFLPIDFVAEEASRSFENIYDWEPDNVYDLMTSYLRWSLSAADSVDLAYWKNEEYYIQMVVEKVDLVTIFSPVCDRYKIPIANSRGWSSMLQRAQYARRFKEAKDMGLKCVLLYCGDHDPDGLRISEFLRKNLKDVKDVTWHDGETGYDPSDLIIDRFGLNYDFIQKNGFTWIDNLITGSKKNLADPNHRNFNMDYVQEYLRDVGERKCEANAIVTLPKIAEEMCNAAIIKYLGDDAWDRFLGKRQEIKNEFNEWKDENDIKGIVYDTIEEINELKPDNQNE